MHETILEGIYKQKMNYLVFRERVMDINHGCTTQKIAYISILWVHNIDLRYYDCFLLFLIYLFT